MLNCFFYNFHQSFLDSSFKNGSLTRERIRDEKSDGSWEKFSEMLKKTPPGNNGALGRKSIFQLCLSLALEMPCFILILPLIRCTKIEKKVGNYN